MRALLLLPLLTGCQLVFGYQGDDVPGDDDDGPDAPEDAADAPPDGPPTGPAIADGDIDGDGTPNAIDPCPFDIAIVPGAPDNDSDGIGDACDPAPNTFNCVVLLDSFEDPAQPPLDGWSGDWVFEGCGGLCSPNQAGSSITYFDRPYDVTHVEARIEALAEFVGTPMIDLFADLSPDNNGTGRACTAKKDGANTRAAVNDLTAGQTIDQISAVITGAVFMSNYGFRWTPPGSGLDCTVDPSTGGVNTVGNVATQIPAGLKRVGVRATDTRARIRYIIAYSDGACPQ